MTAPGLILVAWILEAAFGWPNWLFRVVRHPVVWFGALVRRFVTLLNRSGWTHHVRYMAGAFSAVVAIAMATFSAWGITQALPDTMAGFAGQALIASSLIASRSLYTHVNAVARALSVNDLCAARGAVSQIVGRDPARLDEAGVARAALESLAENASDGVIAPVFWGALFGLPGIAAYKAINTLDSMIGHRNDTYAAFGGFAARLDDFANLVPARLTGLLISVASLRPRSAQVMLRDAGRHRSPNAGWPEAALAGALGVRLSGPRIYAERVSQEPWLNAGAPDPDAQALQRGLGVYVRAMVLGACLLAAIAWMRWAI